jgi:hypothetical protein
VTIRGRAAAMQQIADWLEKLGMPEYGECFAENKIDLSVLPHLTDQDLKDIGVPPEHRRKMLAAISETVGATPEMAVVPKPHDIAERRQVTVMFSDLVVRQHCPRVWTPRTCARLFPPTKNASRAWWGVSAGPWSPAPDIAKAEAYFERALAVARAQEAKSWELRAAMSVARLWRDQGNRAEVAICSLQCTAGSPRALIHSI